MTRVAVKFERKGMLKYLSHLDMQRTFSRALRRSGLAVKKSSGFNPHIVTSFASALSVGTESIGEYMEFGILIDYTENEIKKALNSVMPEGIIITEAYLLKEGSKKLSALVTSAGIEFSVDENNKARFIAACADFLKQKECVVQKRSKSGIKDVDIMPLIYSAEIGERIIFRIAHSNDASLNPFLLLSCIISDFNDKIAVNICRTDLYTSDNQSLSKALC